MGTTLDDILNVDDLVWLRSTIASGGARAIREGAGLSLTEFSVPLGVSPSCLSRWERNLRRPTGEQAVRYAALLRRIAR